LQRGLASLLQLLVHRGHDCTTSVAVESITAIAAAVLMCAVDGMWGPWKMISKKGESGVWWRAELQPAYHVFKGAQGVFQGAAGGVGSLFNKLKR